MSVTPQLDVSVTANWRYDTSGQPVDPGEGQLADSAGELYVSATDDDAWTRDLTLLDVGDVARLAEASDTRRWQQYELTGPAVDNGTWVLLPVTATTSSQQPFNPADNDLLTVTFLRVDVPVPAPPAATLLCTVDEVLKTLKVPDNPDTRAQIEQTIESASAAIQTYAKRVFTSAPGIRTYLPEDVGFGTWYAETDDIAQIESVSDTGGLPVDYVPAPANLQPGWPVTGLVLPAGGLISVAGEFGWPQVPEDIHYAAIQQSTAWYTFDSSRLGDSWADELGPGSRSVPPVPRSLMNSVRQLVQPYRRVSMA